MEDSEQTFDYHFYSALFKKYIPNKNIKIKVIGSCVEVLDLYYKIADNNINNSFAIIDRDYDGIISSRIKDYRLLYTYGYSWENDFWSLKICTTLINVFTMNSVHALAEFYKKISYAERRLSFAHRANLSFRINGMSLFYLGKKGGDDGISIHPSSKTLVTKKELSKFIAKARSTDNLNEIKKQMIAISGSSCRLIQGHYWEFLILQFINALSKKHSITRTTAPHETIKAMAFSYFSAAPESFLHEEVKNHYECAFEPFIRN